ncbi:MAG: LysR family transcriptional regulator [Bacteroidota bacterium]|jgi:DNA-binding transcriptional LysR family regulator
MHYTLHQLQVFYKICKTQSITKAAEELHLTQPAVSIQLKNFQEQFEFPLTEIIGRKLYITDFGREICDAAERILTEVDAIEHKVKAFKGQLFGKLKISVVSTGKYIMPYYLTEFLKNNPGIQLQLDVTNKSKVIESLEKNEVDLSLVSILPDHLQLGSVELLENNLFLVGSNHCGMNEKKYDRKILANLPLIFREPGSGTRQSMENFLELNEIQVKKSLELTSNEAVKQAVIADLGFSVMPLIGIKNEIATGLLKLIPVDGLPITTRWNLIWQKNKKFSPVANAFLKYIEENKEQIGKQFMATGPDN